MPSTSLRRSISRLLRLRCVPSMNSRAPGVSCGPCAPARWARIPALAGEVEQALAVLDTPVARLIARGEERPLLLEEVEALLASKALVIDACRNLVRERNTLVRLARRPVLFALARTLGEAWPGDVPRDVLLARAFGAKHADESHRARLRVEIGRLRRVLTAETTATEEE